MTKNIIEIKRLVKKFGDFTALDGVDLNVYEGEVFGLLGPNGAGKTTIINVVLGLLKQTSGSVYVNGLDNTKHIEEIKRAIGMMTQETVVENELTARENLELFAKLYQVDNDKIPKRVEYALEEADLVKFGDVRAGTFSGGMQRRLELVKSMIHNPPILILDEPTTGLDVQNRTELWKRIRALNKEGITVILTTQYLEEADALCDRIAIIDHGKIKAIGTVSELKALVGTGNVLEIIAKPDDIDDIVKLLKKYDIDAVVKSDKITASLGKDSSRMFTKITNAIEDKKIQVLAISAHLPTLDDVFIKLTGGQIRDSTGENASAMTRARLMKKR
ncbi:MAG: ATP-binding cassette domain-containing protein [Candidatus Micrarchaeaceae archaeon]|jgi:ABC-2 type transport system ATP-binding protein|nr:ATP-binding cassette domain-containing protein [Candidatus Micrarchaeota archaeon]HII09513.1 ATP-binding cassette domain-containing protein [Candidatus Micrarchaeota archaeon]